MAASLHMVPLLSQSAITTAPPGACKRLSELEKRLQDWQELLEHHDKSERSYGRPCALKIRQHTYENMHTYAD